MANDPGVTEIIPMREEMEALTLPESLGAFVRERADAMGHATLGIWFDEGETFTYRQLDEAADRLASSLLLQGVRKGTHVAVMLPNVPAFPITWVALGRIGAIMIPVNTAYTGEELHFVLSDSDSQFLVIGEEYLETFLGMDERPPLVEDPRVIVHGKPVEGHTHWQALRDAGAAPFTPPTPVMRSDLLNIQYTSGTTGFPKGCMLTHDYWMLIGHYAARFRDNNRGDIKHTLIWAPFFYMDPMWQFLMTMKLGATAHVARRISLTRFYDWLKDYRINYCIFPEPALKAREPSPADGELFLKYVSIYGWRREAREEVQRRFSVVAREGYGMTEIGGATIVPTAATEKALIPTCGLPGPFRELRIVDEEGNDVPDGETGELWVAGRSILLGYYKRPEANKDSFRGRWFRTGDVFRRDEDGYYYIVGRIKDMIKRAGENIAAAEVEAALRAMDEIEEAAVIPVPDPMRKEEVKAYLLLREGVTKDDVPPEKVIAHCEKRLAAFKIPRFVTYVTDFPRTPSRKIQKRHLIAASDDLRAGAWDRQDGTWH
ncbi:class I adenylate-forming enzyme family protein [Oceanibacterium hippocampi]|uniref:Long-chain-fatty-acid--CoA ligase n=1 Tax=Oceanibacterium hippocampi TaxID=745714 RepID=A0A1Y5U0N4_9PROT|nr:AMP-binding protein [Oceanibacterium hippocampi]SLN75695.1 Long-chain-fatty-acid--CoA ligase [Oceanibacterium hippocampi]